MPHASRVRRVLQTALVLAAAVSLGACDVVVSSVDGGRSVAADTWTRTYTLGTGGVVAVLNTNGRIEVEGVDGSTVDVRAEIRTRAGSEEAARDLLRQVQIREESSASSIRIETRYPKGLRRAGVDVAYRLRVPRWARVEVETVNGGVKVADIQGAVRAETTNGGVQGRGLTGAVVASATNGGIDVRVTAVAADGVSLETTNGGIDLQVPESAKGTISARCVNGGIRVSDLAVEKVQSSRRRFDGDLNGGGAAIKLETVNGGIRVRPLRGDTAAARSGASTD